MHERGEALKYYLKDDVDELLENLKAEYRKLKMFGTEHIICKVHDFIEELQTYEMR